MLHVIEKNTERDKQAPLLFRHKGSFGASVDVYLSLYGSESKSSKYFSRMVLYMSKLLGMGQSRLNSIKGPG